MRGTQLTQEILNVLPVKGDDAFDLFLKALRDSGQHSIYKQLYGAAMGHFTCCC